MPTSGPARAISLVGLGAAGLVGGHAIGYAVAVPDVHHRAAVIAQTGHGYLPSVSWAAVVLGLAAVVAGLAVGYVRRGDSSGAGWRSVLGRMIPVQVGAFVALEVLERLLAGASMGTFSVRLAFVGVMTQILVSLLAAILLVGLRRAGAALSRAGRVAVPMPLPCRIAVLAERRRGPGRRWAQRVRAPPGARAA